MTSPVDVDVDSDGVVWAVLDDGTVVMSGDAADRSDALAVTDVIRIACGRGGDHVLVLRSDGTVVAAGYNSRGQADVPEDLDGVVAIAAGLHHSLALTGDGQVVGWGFDPNEWRYFKAGGNDTSECGQGAEPPAKAHDVVAIAAGRVHSVALRSDGVVVAWGCPWDGQTHVPTSATDTANPVVAIAAGDFHSLALHVDGTVTGWGKDDYNQAVPPPGLSGVVAIAASNNRSVAITAVGELITWGEGTAAEGPEQVAWKQLAVGAGHVVALGPDGQVEAWGSNALGQCDVPDGLGGVVAVAAGSDHSVALCDDGSVVTWGGKSRQAPVSTVGWDDEFDDDDDWDDGALSTDALSSGRREAPAGLPTTAIAAGGRFTVTLRDDGTIGVAGKMLTRPTLADLRTVVDHLHGQGIVDYIGDLMADEGDDPEMALGPDWSASDEAAVMTYGLYTEFIEEEYFDNVDIADAAMALDVDLWPAHPDGLPGTVAVVAGGSIAAALSSAGRVTTWTDFGQLWAQPPDGLRTVVAIAAGTSHIVALTDDTRVVSWGHPSHPDQDAYPYPPFTPPSWCVPPADLVGVVAIAAGHDHSMALRSDGTVVVWGEDDRGQCDVPATCRNVVAIAAGRKTCAAVTAAGEVVTWGASAAGTAGVTDAVSVAFGSGGDTLAVHHADGSAQIFAPGGLATPVAPDTGLRSVTAMATAGGTTVVLTAGSQAWVWPNTIQPIPLSFGAQA